VESIQELRRLVQEPVEHRNDLTGKLYGSRISIFITRFFLKHSWHANVASFLMLFNGLAGSALLVFPGWPQVVGFFLLETYYLFDCADGEIARYHRISHLKAAYYDYMAHVLVKSAMFLGLGIGLARDPAVAHPWPVFVALSPMLAILFTKIAADVHNVIFCQKFLFPGDREAVENFLERRAAIRGADAGREAGGARRSRLGMVRELALNFDVYLILFMVGALLDLVLPAPAFLPAWLGFKMALFLLYSVALPLNFLDHFVADLTTNRMLGRIHALQGRLEKTTDDQGDNHR
jgi:hypothetical protein